MRPASILLLMLLALVAALGWFVAKGERGAMEPAEPDVVAEVAARPVETAAAEASEVERIELEPEVAAEVELAPEVAAGALGPCRVRVVEARTSSPVAGASVFVIRASPLERMFRLSKDFVASEESSDCKRIGVTDAEGIVVVEPHERGDWIWASEGGRFGAIGRPAEESERTLVLHVPERLELEVHDASGAPAAGVRVLELGELADFVTDATGRVTLPMAPLPIAGAEASLEFVLPLVGSTPRRHKVRVSSKPRSPLKFTLGPNGTLELVATANGRPLAVDGLSIRWGGLVPDTDGLERTWFWDEATTTGSVLVPHVGVGRELWGRAFHSSFEFARTELAPLERAGELAVRTIPFERGRVRFRGVAVDSNGVPLRELHIVVSTCGTRGGEPQTRPFKFAGRASPTGAFDIVETWRDGAEQPDWEPGPSVEFEALSDELESWVATMDTPVWTFDLGLSRARTLEFGTVVFRHAGTTVRSR
jgi:hypothetical protein